ncbi:hypothetical protein TcG_09241, partial [Trypanosoma cruzi]
PLPSLSNTRNASLISSSESESCILRAISVRNSGKSMVPLPVLVHLVDHVLQLRLRRVLAQRAHHRAELLRRDGAIAVLVEQREGLLELGDLLVGQLISLF